MIMRKNACIIRNKELKDSITAMITNSLDSSDHLLHGELIAKKIAFLSVINRRDAPPVSPKSQTETANSMFHSDRLRRHSYHTRIKILLEAIFFMRCIF